MIQRTPLARLLLALALFAVGLKGLVPSGYMLEARERSLVVVLCSAHGGGALQFDLRTGEFRDANTPAEAPGDTQKRGEAACLFAAAAPLAPPTMVAALPTPAGSDWRAVTPASMPAPGRGLAAPPPWATGPPATI